MGRKFANSLKNMKSAKSEKKTDNKAAKNKSIGNMVAQGVALGVGSAVAHRAIASASNDSIDNLVKDSCNNHKEALIQCINLDSQNDCQQYLNRWQECKLNNF